MLSEVHIENFKSIRDLKLSLGRVTVLIGENGCGKSNILEAIGMASAAVADKLDHEFLASRGIRVTEPRFMRSAFEGNTEAITIATRSSSGRAMTVELDSIEDEPYADEWNSNLKGVEDASPKNDQFVAADQYPRGIAAVRRYRAIRRATSQRISTLFGLDPDFLIYSPENTALRTFSEEGQIQPLGIKGEGLFKLLKVLSGDAGRFAELCENLRLLDWFEDLRLPSALAPFEHTLQIRDRFLEQGEGAAADAALADFDQRSSNEGFLFLLFYFALFISQHTPRFFAIDNVDASLNPKLCTELMRRLCALAEAHDKQVIITTHNPAILDGLNLHDEAQQLHVVHRSSKGHTRARRVTPPQPVADEPPIKLSEAFLRGLLGGLPQNF